MGHSVEINQPMGDVLSRSEIDRDVLGERELKPGGDDRVLGHLIEARDRGTEAGEGVTLRGAGPQRAGGRDTCDGPVAECEECHQALRAAGELGQGLVRHPELKGSQHGKLKTVAAERRPSRRRVEAKGTLSHIALSHRLVTLP